jgi:ribosomal protein L19
VSGFSRTALVEERAMSAIELAEKSQMTERPDMKSGDTVRVHVKVREGDKERIQIFEGIVIGLHRGGLRSSFTVRKVSSASFHCTRRRLPRSTSCAPLESAAPSYTSSAI